MINAPFSPEPVNDAAHFVGRERPIVQISELLADGRSCAVVGPTGSGKTSLLWHLGQVSALVLDPAPVTVYLDLAGVRTTADFYEPILRALGARGDDELALGQALNDVPERSVLLLLDRLERAGAGLSGVVRSAIRGWIREQQLLVVAASAGPLDQAAPDLQTVLLQITLPLMPEREARAMVLERLEQAGLEAPAADISELVVLAGGVPERLRRATELWARSVGGTKFDWRRSFQQEYSQLAALSDTLAADNPSLEVQSGAVHANVLPSRATLRQRMRENRRRSPLDRNYAEEVPTHYLLAILLLSLAVLVGWSIGGWLGVATCIVMLAVYVVLARMLIRNSAPNAISQVFVAAVRGLPLVGRFVPKR